MIDNEIDEFYIKNHSFTVDDIFNKLNVIKDPKLCKEQIARALDSDSRFFCDSTKQHFFSKKMFFHHAEFVITPDEAEINEGILFPGHRFIAFCNEDVFPSEITLRECGGPNLKTQKKTLKISELTQYHLLMGTEQISDFLAAEDEDHDVFNSKASSESLVTLNVFDLKKIYADTNFKFGDILVCRVLDWERGEFDFTYRIKSSRTTDSIQDWVDNYSDALEKVIDDYERYFELPEFLTWAFFYGGKTLFGENGASLDEFYHLTERIEIRFEQGQSFFAKTAEDDSSGEDATETGAEDDLLSISAGATSSIEEIMRETGTPMTMNELDAFMLDSCLNRELEFDDLYARCFGERRLGFADGAQEVIFMNYLEDRWESISSNYDRHRDEFKAKVRGSILEATQERLDWLHALADLEILSAQLPRAEMKKLAKLAKHLDDILGMLNSEKYELSEDEAENMMDIVGESSDLQAELLGKMSDWMNHLT